METSKNLLRKIYVEVLKCGKSFNISEDCKQDYLHDAFIYVVGKIDERYEEKGKLGAWVMKVATNYIRTRLKRDNPVQICSFDELQGHSIPSYDDGGKDIRRKVVVEIALKACESLAPSDNEMIVGKANGSSFQKLANEFEYNVKTVRRRVKNIRSRIINAITKEYNENYDDGFEYWDI